ncbi:MAG TPA: hypothetical protein VKR57_09705 [Terriglobales bacterium]|nr:hypothetical protein [Terriglobales bacterium]
MKRNSRIRRTGVLAAALLMSLFFIASSQAQTDLVVFAGKFTLTDQVLWGKTVLQPGDYTITVGFTSMPTFALVRDGKGRAVARFASRIDSGLTSAGNALLIREKDGQLRVYSLALRSLGRVLVYDPALAREAVLPARAPHTVPVMLANK